MKYLLPFLFLVGCASAKTYDQGVVQGCMDTYRDLYNKLGVKDIDESSLASFCASKYETQK